MVTVVATDGDGGSDSATATIDVTNLLGLGCVGLPGDPQPPLAGLSGSWYDPDHNGEGYVLEVLADGRVVVYWFVCLTGVFLARLFFSESSGLNSQTGGLSSTMGWKLQTSGSLR